MGKLEAAFSANNHSAATATKTYQTLQGVIGETDQSVEAAQQISLLAESEEDAAKWAGLAAGVVGQFGDALQPETFYEAANKTLKLGETTDAFTQMLEGTGMNVEQFNADLAACTTEQEKQAYMLQITEQALGAAGEKYKDVNGEVIRANQANDAWMQSLSGVGGAIEPIITDVKLLGASMVSELVPGVQQVADAFRGMLNGDAGAADGLGAALSGLITQLLSKVTELAPTLVQVAVSLVGTLTTSLLQQLPAITQTLLQILGDVLGQLSNLLPQVATTVVEVIPLIVSSLLQAVPDLVAAAASLITSLAAALPGLLSTIVQALPGLVEELCTALVNSAPLILEAIVQTVETLVGMLPVLIPQIVEMVTSIITMLTEQLPVLLPQIVQALVSVVTLLTEQLPVIIPMLIEACISIVTALVQALPTILSSLLQALPSALQAVWNAIVMVFRNLPAWFGQLFQGAVDIIASVFGAVGEFFSDIWTGICDIFAPATDWFGDIFSKAWTGIKNAFSGVKSFFSGIWSGIKNAFSSVTSWFKNTFSGAWTAVKNVFSTGGKIFDGIKDGIANVFKTVVNGIIGGINKVIAVPFNAINSVLQRIKGISIVGVKPFDWIQTFSVPQIPKLAKGGVLERGQVGLLEGDGAEAVVPLERNTEWLQKVAQELYKRLSDNMDGLQIERGLHRRANPLTPAVSAVGDIAAKLDKILTAIKNGQVLTIDKKLLVGGTASDYDSTLGQRRALVERGAL
jgi:phage-related protein